MTRLHVWISGYVTGVAFRAYARRAALHRGLTGWVRNLADGRVEAVFEGEAESVESMLAWCHEGSPMSRVDRVVVREETYRGDFDSFEIRYLWGDF